MKLKQKRRHNFAPTVLFDGRHTNKSSCTILIKSGNFSQLLSNYFAGMSSRFSASRSLYSQIHGISNAFSQGWVRGDTVTVTRYVRDIDEDKSRLFTETFQLPSGISEVTHSLFPVKGTNSEAIRPIFQDISPSGNLTLSLRQSGKGDEIPLINLIGSQNSHYLDVSDYHGKFVGDSWFGGVTWSDDERFVAYVAYKKENSLKKADSSKYFESRTSEKDMNKFEYVDDWGEKYVGLVSLSLNVLNTITGEVSTVQGIDDEISTIGQPVFLPLIKDDDSDESSINRCNSSEKKNNEEAVKPSYRLAYTSWKNGPKKLGMIYCYQRESSICVVDLTDQLISADVIASVDNIIPISNTNKNNEDVTIHNFKSNDISRDKVQDSENYKKHVLVTPGVKLARSARFSPNGRKMIFLGSRNGFLSHSGCTEILSVEVTDILKLLNKNKNDVVDETKDITVNTIISTVHAVNDLQENIIDSTNKNIPKNRNGDQNVNIIKTSFPGIYTDQLPRKCFLNDDLIILTSTWGSVESLILVEISTKKVEKIMNPKGTKNSEILQKFGQLSCVLLDVSKVKSISYKNEKKNIDNKNKDRIEMDDSCMNNVLLSISSPTATATVAILKVIIHNKSKHMSDNDNTKNSEQTEENTIIDKISCTLFSPSNYTPDQIPIARRKPPTSRISKQLINEVIQSPHEIEVIEGLKENEKINKYRIRNLSDKLMSNNNFNNLLNWKTTRYYDDKGIPYESILISPKSISNKIDNNDNTVDCDIDDSESIDKCPLIVVPHGGPHSCMTTSYVASYTFLCLHLGAAVLHVNYRGSTGFGQDSIDSLLGQIGVVDVADMVHCTLDAIEKNSMLDGDRVAVVGGSHGGFLAAHLIGQHPDIYKVACMRNPVTDIPGMLTVTDIPDWCYLEALGKEGALKYSKQNKKSFVERILESGADQIKLNVDDEDIDMDDFNTMPDPEDLLKMRSCSPIIYAKNVRAPVLMLIGGKDRRVPMSQGVAYYHTLRAKGVNTKLLVFPEDVHAIDRPLSEAEQWMAVADWLETYLI